MKQQKKGSAFYKENQSGMGSDVANHRYKYRYFSTQCQQVAKAFSGIPKTMLEVSHETNIERASICRYVSNLKKKGQIHLVKIGICSISKHRAGRYITTLGKGAAND